MKTYMKMLKVLAFVSVCVAAACDDATIPPGGDPGLGIATLQIGPDPLVLFPGDTVQLTAIARSAYGAIIPNPVVTWQSSDTTALTITASGRATALRADDSVRITARADTKTASFEPNLCSKIFYSSDPYSPLDRPGIFRLWGHSGEFEEGKFDKTSVLWGGSIMYGTNEADFVIASSPTGHISHAPVGPSCSLDTPDGRYIRNGIVISPYIMNAPVSPVRATEEIFSPSHPLAEGVILIRYTFRNVTNQRVENFRAGVWLDWDLLFNGFGSNDYARFNSLEGSAEAFESTMETAGIAGINTPITSYRATVGPMGVSTVAHHMALLTPGTPDVSGPGDVRIVAGFGPFAIAAGQSQSVMIVMTAGRTREDFERRISIGRSAASLFPSIPASLSP